MVEEEEATAAAEAGVTPVLLLSPFPLLLFLFPLSRFSTLPCRLCVPKTRRERKEGGEGSSGSEGREGGPTEWPGNRKEKVERGERERERRAREEVSKA